MRKFVITLLTATLFFCGTSAMAASFYYEATDVSGAGTVTYNVYSPTTAPSFNFVGNSGTVATNLNDFEAGTYIVDVTLTKFTLDTNEDGTSDFNSADLPAFMDLYGVPLSGSYGDLSYQVNDTTVSLSLASTYFPDMSGAGTFGALAYNFDPSRSLFLSYDFGTTGTFTNSNVSAQLAYLDSAYGGGANGVMTSDIGWESFRVDFTPVPEPSTFILLGVGVAGLAFYRRKKS